VVARIGSNEGIQMPGHPLSDVLPADVLDLCRLYPDPYARNLRQQLAKLALGAVQDAEHILIDSGADSLILLTLRTRIVPGDVVVTSKGSYPTFNYFAQGLGANIVEVPYADDGATTLRPNLAELAVAAHAKRAALVYLANPDNPTGHVFRYAHRHHANLGKPHSNKSTSEPDQPDQPHLWSSPSWPPTFPFLLTAHRIAHSPSEVSKLRSELPTQTTLIVDEAYIDFSPENVLPVRLPNTVQLRTLSKAYGLAGLRIGLFSLYLKAAYTSSLRPHTKVAEGLIH
jgi:histidinol-phosphate aminotransferase